MIGRNNHFCVTMFIFNEKKRLKSRRCDIHRRLYIWHLCSMTVIHYNAVLSHILPLSAAASCDLNIALSHIGIFNHILMNCAASYIPANTATVFTFTVQLQLLVLGAEGFK